MRKKTLFYLILFFYVIVNAKGQIGFHDNGIMNCGSNDVMNQLFRKSPTYSQINKQIEDKILNAKQNHQKILRPQSVVTLPVVVHIIHNNGPENLSNARVLEGIQHLNEAFANTGYYNPLTGVNTNIQFCLAQRDPNGNITNGITRDVSTYTNMGGPFYYSDDLNVKNINRWNPNCYINIWLVNDIPGAVAGYAYLPSAHGSIYDGIIEEAQYFGSSYSNDVVAIHEMGHYLGLYHTFEGGCNNNNCSTDGDKVCDTPPDNSTAYTSCGIAVNSCSTDIISGFTSDINDITEDYMDYGNLNCMNIFTQGQADRMNWFITNVRNSLVQCLSCQTPCNAPVSADFSSSTQNAPVGTSIMFTNSSVNGATFQWFINNSLVSTNFNYTHLFTIQGIYIIKLHVESNIPNQCIGADKYDTITINCTTTSGFSPSYNGVIEQGQSVTFINTSLNANSYQWYYDNSLVSTSTNYTANFSSLGTHFIKLKSISAFCTDSFQVYYLVQPSVQNGGNISYQKKYSFETGDYFNYGALITPQEDIILVGGNNSSNKNLVSKYDKFGNVIWSKRYNDNQLSRLQSALNTLDNKYAFGGDRWLDDIGIIKADTNGNIIFSASYSQSNSNYVYHRFNDMIQLDDSAFVFATTVDYSATTKKILVFKVDKNGAVLWSNLIAANQCEAAKLYAVGNGIYLVGSTTSQIGFNSTPNWDGLLVKINPLNGNKMFVTKFDASNRPNKFTGITSLGNNLLINGHTIDTQNQSLYLSKTITKIDFNGNLIQQKELTMGTGSSADATMMMQNNFIYLATNDRTTGKIFLCQIDTALQIIEAKMYKHDNADVNITNLFKLNTGNLIMAGDRGAQFTLLIRTLPNLTTPGCNDSIFFPQWLTSPSLVTSITTTTLFSNEPLNIFTPSWITQTIPHLAFTICNYLPINTTCDSVLVQNLYTTTNQGISGSNGSIVSVAQRTNQNFLLGCQNSFSIANIIETDKNGVVFNNRKLEGIDFLTEIKITPDNGYVVLGSKNFGAEIYVYKFDALGNNQWVKEYDIQSTSGLRANHILPTIDGGYFVTCSNYLLRLDINGDVVYAKRFISFSTGIIETMVQNGTQVLLGFHGDDGGIICIDINTGTEIWNNNLKAKNILRTNTGYFVSGYFATPLDGVIYKLNFSGNVISKHIINIPDATFLNHKLAYDNITATLVLVCNKLNGNEFNTNNSFIIGLDTLLNITTSAKSASGIHTINYGDAICSNKKLYFAGNGFDNRLNLVNKYPALFSFPITNLSNNCFFDPTSATSTQQTTPAVNTINYNQINATIITTPIVYNYLPLEIFSNTACLANNCTIPLTCDTIRCNIFSLNNFDKVCHLADTLKINLNRGNGCTLVPNWSINTTVPYQITLQNDSSLHIVFGAPGNAKIKVEGFLSCKILTDSTNVTIFNSPLSLNLGSDLQLCDNSLAILRAGSGFQSYKWQDNSTDSIFTATTPGIYFVSAKDYCNNIYKDTIVITHLIPPSIYIGNDTTLCIGDSITLSTSNNFYDYHWAPNYNISAINAPVINVWPTVDTIYTLVASYSETCTLLDTIKITSKPITPVFLGNDTSFCQNSSITLNAGNNFTSYLWNTGATTQTIIVSNQGVYTVTATNSNGCKTKDTLNVINVFPLPILNLGIDTNICFGNSITFDAGNGYASYLWQNNSTLQTFTTNNIGTFWVEVKNNNNCIKRDSVSILSILAKPLVFLGNDTTICKGKSITLNPGNGFLKYLWQDGSVLHYKSATLSGEYWVEITSQNGCTNRDSFRLLPLLDTPQNFIDKVIYICKEDKKFIKPSLSFNSYLWSTGSTNDSIIINKTDNYWLQVTNNNGCAGKESFTTMEKNCIYGIHFPNAFTPNGDNKNDVYKPLVYDDIEEYEFAIFNRYGQIIFISKIHDKGWDGTFNNIKQEIGTYIWSCTYKFKTRGKKETQNGSVLLIR